MKRLFSYAGKTGRGEFALIALVSLLLPHLLILIWLIIANGPLPRPSSQFVLMPLRWIVGAGDVINGAKSPVPAGYQNLLFLLAAGLTVATSWVLSAAALRRANDAGWGGWVAPLAITPVLQLPTILLLMAAPLGRTVSPTLKAEATPEPTAARAAVKGLLAAVGLTLLVVAVGALVFRSYGYTLFVLSPVVIGTTSAYFANRGANRSWGDTVRTMTLALAIGGLSLIVCALEGVVCILMAAPLAWIMALIGAGIGRAMALAGRRTPLASIAVLPLMFASEQLVSRTVPFSDTQSVEVAAPAAKVWQAVLHMDTIEQAPALPFRLGVAYPVRGEVIGEGVGAIRKGYFSTGVAVEHVTEWDPERVLGFDIASEPPSLRELSPYGDIKSPHVDGYFRSVHARIVLTPLGPNRTRLILQTTHELDLQPGFYWLPMAQWVVRQNKARVLGQMRAQAEGG